MGWGQGEEMTQALYAHMNNKTMKKKKRKKRSSIFFSFLLHTFLLTPPFILTLSS
jgi:hypothetical protein